MFENIRKAIEGLIGETLYCPKCNHPITVKGSTLEGSEIDLACSNCGRTTRLSIVRGHTAGTISIRGKDAVYVSSGLKESLQEQGEDLKASGRISKYRVIERRFVDLDYLESTHELHVLYK